jgi:hypothetical protein
VIVVVRRKNTWWYVDSPDATFAFAVADGVVVKAAPVARGMLGKTEDEALTWARSLGRVQLLADAFRSKPK